MLVSFCCIGWNFHISKNFNLNSQKNSRTASTHVMQTDAHCITVLTAAYSPQKYSQIVLEDVCRWWCMSRMRFIVFAYLFTK